MYEKDVPALAKMADLWAKFYYAFASEIIKQQGAEKGGKLLIDCIRNYAAIRGASVADYVNKKGLDHNAENFVKYYDAPFAEVQRACLALFPEGKLDSSNGTTFCPYKEIWEKYESGRTIGRIYCEAFHEAMWKSYHPRLRVKQDKIMTKGDDMCTFLTFMEGEEDKGVLIFDQK